MKNFWTLGNPRFVCEVCSIKFKRQSDLNKNHKLVHETDIKNCYQEDLDLHICNQCDFKPSYKDNLKGHIEMVHCLKTKPFFNCIHFSLKTTYKRNLTSNITGVMSVNLPMITNTGFLHAIQYQYHTGWKFCNIIQ